MCASCAFLWLVSSGGLRADRLHMMRIDVMTFDHAIERLAIDGQQARRRLFVATSVLEHARDVTTFDYGESDPVVVCGFSARRWQYYRCCTQVMEKIGAEPAVRYCLLEVAAARRNHAHVYVLRLIRTSSPDLACL